MILDFLLQLQEDELKTTAPKRGGFKFGTKKIKPRHMHRRKQHITQKIFITLLDGVREYNNYFVMNKDYTKIVGFS
jgi:hypothetical protein